MCTEFLPNFRFSSSKILDYLVTLFTASDILQNLLVYYNDNISHVTDDRDSAVAFINCVYSEIVNALHASAQRTVPTRPKNFYKFWWCQELDTLKENSMRDHRIWKDAGRPRSGPIFKAYQTSKLSYKRRIREYERQETSVYIPTTFTRLYCINRDLPFGNVGGQSLIVRKGMIT